MPSTLEHAAALLPSTHPGPGGACAVIRAGEVLLRHSWGWANTARHIPFTPQTLFRMCSITKQFTCALLLDTLPDPAALDPAVRARLPRLTQAAPTTLHLCHNQSGLRDYWAVAMLHGALPETPFGDADAARVIAATRTLQFEPGTRYSYANQNFRLLSDLLQDHTGRSFAELLRTRLFGPAGMHAAFLAADTRAMPDGTEGYEGTPETGFRPADNRILWTGDAGLGASLDDMIAWESHIDATRDDANGLYNRLSAAQSFADGAPAPYGFGLGHQTHFGRRITGHGGALRGWRSYRLHVAQDRISVVTLFNHLNGNAHEAALDLLSAAIGQDRPKPGAYGPEHDPAHRDAQARQPKAAPSDPPRSDPPWLGTYIEPETGLAARIGATPDGRVRLTYGHTPELLPADPGAPLSTRLRPGPGGLWMDRPQDNQSSLLMPSKGDARPGIAGRYHCAELGTDLTIATPGGTPYASPGGFLGQSRMEQLHPIGPDLWTLPCHRALDHTPPGDWTLAFHRENDRVTHLDLGCWLARRLVYDRLS